MFSVFFFFVLSKRPISGMSIGCFVELNCKRFVKVVNFLGRVELKSEVIFRPVTNNSAIRLDSLNVVFHL